MESLPLLSICIATYNRGAFIGETLDSILSQLPAHVELVVVDGASPDNTPEVMANYLRRYPQIRYVREKENSGIDRDYDKAVGYARGEFCWLMTDDDILIHGAIYRVLQELKIDVDLLVVNSEVRTTDFSRILNESMIKHAQDRVYSLAEWPQFFSDTGNALSFIGGTVIRRSVWLERDRNSYFGTLFIHVGVIFQTPMQGKVYVIGTPLIQIRHGNAMWTPRSFEIWMFKWPELIWSFDYFNDEIRRGVVRKFPWKKLKSLIYQRGIGAYSMAEYRQFISLRANQKERLVSIIVAQIPGSFINVLLALYCLMSHRRFSLFDVLRSKYATWLSRWLGRCL